MLKKAMGILGLVRGLLGDCPDFRRAKMGLSPSRSGKLFLYGSLASVCWSPLAGAATLTPVSVDPFFVTPNEPAVLRWTVDSGTLDGPVEATVRDYWGQPAASIPARLKPEKALELTVKLPPGYYDVELSGAEQRFGVVSLAAHQGRPDPFFSIDAAMSWLVRGDEVREDLVKVLSRSGVPMSRERLAWGQITPAPGKWDWDSPLHYETLRHAYARHGVEVLEMFHSTTRWAGRVGKYPDDLVGTMRAWEEIGRRWRPTWGAMEVWNEPDISFGDFLPADQYVPLVQTIAYALHRDGVDVPIVGGVFAHYHQQFLDNAARNGMLELADVASFHTYGRAPGMEGLIGRYRSWLAAHGREAMPLWITECGRPWKRGPDRPPADQDAESALDITMKAVESRACGIARYFAFVYPFYEERDNNFGLMGRHGTPLRSMAAYARLASLLAHKGYLGDLKCDHETIQRARVFGDDRETIAVVYTGKPDPQAKLKLDLPILRAEGIDGRAFTLADDGTLPVPDGLVYLWLDRANLGDRLRSDTPAMQLWKIGQREGPRPETPSPIVLRYEFDAEVVEAKTEGYRFKAATPGKAALAVRVFNLSEQPRELTLELSFSPAPPEATVAQARKVIAPASGLVDVSWDVDLTGAFDADAHAAVQVTATDEAARTVASLVMDLFGPDK